MSDILNAAEVRSGTWGELWLDGEQVAECYGCQIKVNKTKDDVTRCRTLVAGKKMTAVSITGTIRIYNATSRLIKLEAEALKQGKDLRHTIISNLDDPDNADNQRIAVKGVSFEVNEGEIVTLIGANGAGKSTVLNTVSGLLHPKHGSVVFEGKDLKGVPAHKIVERGMAQVPEGRHVFLQMTVEDNLEMGAYTQPNSTIDAGIADVYERFPRLKERRRQIAGTLSGGEQQMLAMGRALMSRPKLLMLDEPSMGLAPILVEQIFDIVRELHAAGTTILLVEQNAQAALSVADRAYVLETGRITLSGTGKELMASDAVRKAYLGG